MYKLHVVLLQPVWLEQIEVLFGKVSNISAFEGEEIINLSVHQNGQIKHF